MEILRQAVSLPIFGFVIWLAWVIAESYGSTMLAALLAGFLLLAIAGWFLGRWPASGWSAVLAGLIILCFVALGAYAKQVLAVSQPAAAASAGTQPGQWQPWSDAAVKQYQSQGRPVFVDFTAKWCLSCQVNERVALTRPEVMKAFEDAHVALLKADWTQQDPAIAQALESLGRNGVPAYALYPPGNGRPTLLPEALTPGIVIDAVHNLPQATPSQAVAAPGRPYQVGAGAKKTAMSCGMMVLSHKTAQNCASGLAGLPEVLRAALDWHLRAPLRHKWRRPPSGRA